MDQIGTTLDLIKDKLNQYLSNIYAENREWVVISNVVSDDGSVYENAKNKLVIFVANIEHETMISTYNRNMPVSNSSYVTVAPPLYINIYLLIYANFSDATYREGIGRISDAISFFQQYPNFTQENLPGLDPVIDKLTFDLVNLSVVDVNYLLTMIGDKYLPSLYYRVRLIPYISEQVQAETPGVSGLQGEGNPSDVPEAPQSSLTSDNYPDTGGSHRSLNGANSPL